MDSPPTKVCASCGREFAWRRKWARDWDSVRYCSDACRRRGVTDRDRQLEDALRAALTRQGVDPQSVAGDTHDAETVRRAARRLVAAGEAQLVQNGRVVDPSAARGRFLVRRPR